MTIRTVFGLRFSTFAPVHFYSVSTQKWCQWIDVRRIFRYEEATECIQTESDNVTYVGQSDFTRHLILLTVKF